MKQKPAKHADDLRLSTRNDVLIAQPVVEIDLSNAEQLGKRIEDAAAREGRGVVIDLGEVDYLDSYGIYVLIGLSQRLTERDQSAVLVVPEDAPVRRPLRIANLEDHLDIVDRVDEALSALAAGRSDP